MSNLAGGHDSGSAAAAVASNGQRGPVVCAAGSLGKSRISHGELANCAQRTRTQQWRFSYIASWPRPGPETDATTYPLPLNVQLELVIGKYVIGWILGVPAIVLVVAYFFFR
jgi:hypothetical protein